MNVLATKNSDIKLKNNHVELQNESPANDETSVILPLFYDNSKGSFLEELRWTLKDYFRISNPPFDVMQALEMQFQINNKRNYHFNHFCEELQIHPKLVKNIVENQVQNLKILLKTGAVEGFILQNELAGKANFLMQLIENKTVINFKYLNSILQKYFGSSFSSDQDILFQLLLEMNGLTENFSPNIEIGVCYFRSKDCSKAELTKVNRRILSILSDCVMPIPVANIEAQLPEAEQIFVAALTHGFKFKNEIGANQNLLLLPYSFCRTLEDKIKNILYRQGQSMTHFDLKNEIVKREPTVYDLSKITRLMKILKSKQVIFNSETQLWSLNYAAIEEQILAKSPISEQNTEGAIARVKNHFMLNEIILESLPLGMIPN